MGVPQGCIISPILFLIYNNYDHEDETEDTKLVSYADDVTILFRESDLDRLQGSLISIFAE